MKITRDFIEDYFTGDREIELLGMRVLYLQILFRLYKGMIPLATLFGSFEKHDIEYFIGSELIKLDHIYAHEGVLKYTEGDF